MTDSASAGLKPKPHHLQDLAIVLDSECYGNSDSPWDSHPPRIASLLAAAAHSCGKLQSLALSGMSEGDDIAQKSAMCDCTLCSVSRLSRLTALALHDDRLTHLSKEMSALKSLRQLCVSNIGSQLFHSLSALPNLHALQVHWCLAY